jgi:sn-glycerol 3-phosphate transport system permease protein
MPAEQLAVIDAPRSLWRKAGRYSLLLVVTFFVLFPVYAMVVAALRPGATTFDRPLVPRHFTLDTIRSAWTEGNLGRYLLNSTVVAVIVVSFQLVTSLLGGYAFAFLDFPGRRVIFAVFVATMLVPAEATVLTNFRTIEWLEWTDTYRALAVPFLVTAAGTFLVRQAFIQIPAELREAAEMDGLGHWRFLYEVAAPLVRPTLGALGLFSFLTTWNQYLWPTFVTNDDKMRTVQAGLKALRARGIDEPNLVMAGTLIAALPIVLILIFFQKQLVRGLTAGAVKG